MVFKENLVCVIKNHGNILREIDGIVYLPFTSDYSILLKNLNSRRASVNISIDGKDVLDNKSLIIEPNSETELEGFLDGSAAKNKFKFIQKTKEIKDYRGDYIDDGMIRIEFAYEKVPSYKYTYTQNNFHQYVPPVTLGSVPPILNSSTTSVFNSFVGPNIRSSSKLTNNNSDIDEGITVKGSKINQNFNYTSIGSLEPAEVIILKLRGEKISKVKVTKSVTVKTKLRCSSCGKKSKSSSQFCSACGTFLE
jgi:hypothetical protein